MRKSRVKKEKEAVTPTHNEPTTETIDELAATTAPTTSSTPTQHHHDEGIVPK